jgi:hypothetical protein
MLRTLLLLAALAALTLPAGRAPAGDPGAPGVVVDPAKRTVTVDARVAPRKINDERYKEIYPIEVIACWPFPRGQKAHETVVTIEAKPSAVHKALEGLGLKPGKPAFGEDKEPARGPKVNIYLELPAEGGGTRKVPIERTLLDPKTNKPMPKVEWRFTGSVLTQPDPTGDEKAYGADLPNKGTLIAIFPVTNETVFQSNLTMKEEKYVKLETDKRLLPPEGTPVKLVIEVPAAP